MLHATLRSLLARKLRLVLAGFAVLLGVSFVSGTYVLTDSLGRVFDGLFADVNAGTAVTVRGVSALGGSESIDREPVSQAVLDKVTHVAGVDEVAGRIQGYAQVVDKKGKAFKTGGAPSLGVEIAVGSKLEGLQVKRGAAPVGPDQAALDATTVRKTGLQLGDRITVLLKGPARKVTLVGVVGLQNVDSLAGASLVAFDPPTAQRLLGDPGTWTELAVAADSGVPPAQLRTRIAAVLPKGVEAVTVTQSIDEQSKALQKGLGFINTALLVFAGVSLFVGAFLIFNTFTMLVAQRARELALLRALGASRRQVIGSVVVEALAVGVFSSVAGFFLGIGVAKGLEALMAAVGIDLPAGATVIAPRTLVVSLVVGIGVTLAAALLPARKASLVAPVQAMRESGPAEDRSLTRRTLVGSGLLAAGVAALTLGLSQGVLPLVGLGAAVSFLGVASLSPLVARPVVSALGLPFAKIGISGRLGRGNAVRSPRRTSATAAALMVGLALVATVSTLGASAKKSVVAIVDTSLGADYVLHTENFLPFSPVAATELQKKAELASVAAFRLGKAKVDGHRIQISGVDPVALQAVLKLDVKKGDLATLGKGEIAVSQDEADSRGIHVGDTVPVVWARTGLRPTKVGAVFAKNQFAGGYLVSDKTYDANVTEKLIGVIAIRSAHSATPVQSRAAIAAAVKDFPNIVVEDRAQFVRSQGDQVDSALNVITVLLVLSVLIALLGVVNTLALSVVERTRELGLLRAVGLQRRQLRRMIRIESVIISVYGAALGILVGLCFGWALVQALKDQGITEFAVPYSRLVMVLLVAGFGGVVAAALPARRAARLDVLKAVESI